MKDYQEVLDESKIEVVRNGYNGDVLMFRLKKKAKKYVLAYVGTISHWFDFDILLKSLKDFKNIEYRLIGPVMELQFPKMKE
ncbi:MAG: hypothetical protein ACLT8V_00275 [Streptococcus salivarius]